MKPDSYIPLYGNDLFHAMAGYSGEIGWAYLRIIWHYWSHEHCAGLKDESDLLRRIACIEKSDWDEIYAVIFDNDKFFTLGEDGLWHQKRADEEWQISVQKYERVLSGSKARWHNYSPKERTKAARHAAQSRWNK